MLGAAPFPVINSDHQDDIAFLVGDPYKPSFATITGKGDNPTYMDIAKKNFATAQKLGEFPSFQSSLKEMFYILGLETLGLITFQQGWIFVLSNTSV